MEHTDLDLLFHPRSLAIVGASPDFTKGGGFIWWRVKEHGYPGRKYPISKRLAELDGVACHASVADIDEAPDLVVIAVPAAAAESVMLDCARRQVRFVVIHAAGFAELGEEGKVLQHRVIEAARSAGIRVVGPNCMGLCSPSASLNTVVDIQEADMVPGGVSFCGQSGWATEHFLAGGSARGLRFSKVISTGNQADLDLNDYLSYFGHDDRTRVACAYVEGTPRGRAFLELASEVSAEKPVVIWKSGFSRAGAKAALSHSGSLAGDRDVWTGAARSAGIVRADCFEDLIDLAAAFSSPVLPKGRKVGIMAEAGGGGIAASDACEGLGLDVPAFSPELQARLKAYLQDHLPPFSGLGNPLDLVWMPMDKALTLCRTSLEMIAAEVDAVITMSYMPFFLEEFRPAYIEMLRQARDELGLPIFIVPPYTARAAAAMKEFTLAGLPALPSFERAAKAVWATSGYQAWASAR
ncbi:MAG: CoA-binding protein [Proteobacteria bacterium]|nr:CoA-binding protein [Pseudomonadota bacterium]